jgi:hypothetical protein
MKEAIHRLPEMSNNMAHKGNVSGVGYTQWLFEH